MIFGLCHICGHPATRTCPACGMPTCERCMNRKSGVCMACSKARNDDIPVDRSKGDRKVFR